MDFSLLFTLWLAAFAAATLLPTASEAVLAAMLLQHPQYAWLLWATASFGNTAGSLTSYAVGRFLPQRRRAPGRAADRLQRHGAPVLLLSWLPAVGDALPLAAGWLRLPFWHCLFWIALGKSLRYGVLACLVLWP